MRSALVLVVLSACAAAPRVLGTAHDFVPLETGRTWTYDVADEDGRKIRIAAESKGGDMRSLPGEPRVRFQFVYGTLTGKDHDGPKSIYALSRDGPREFYFDAWLWSLWHGPPIPLLPAEVRVGNEVRWEGRVEPENEEVPATAVVRVEAVEGETVRTTTTYTGLPLEVRRWFTRGVGLVRMEVRSSKTLRLVQQHELAGRVR
jgi:hypothetical protein